MNRTLRNGLAVAGMAGGIFFLGQAVASATDGVTQDNTAPVVQTDGGSGSNDADVDQSNRTSVDAEANAGSAGVNVGIGNNVGGNTVNSGGSTEADGASTLTKPEGPKPPPPPTTTTVRVAFNTNITNDVKVDSTIVDSGNAVVDVPKISQSNSAPVTQTTTESDHHKGPWDGKKDDTQTFSGPSMGGKGGNDADIDQHNSAHLDLDANAGDVGVNVGIENNVGGNTVNCWGAEHSSVVCDVTFNTTINNNVDIHSIICGSGNAVIGTLPAFVCNLGPAPAAPAPAAPAAAAKHAASAKHASAPKVSSAGKGELAFTGAETSLPLTLGLLALGAGGALTLAGRRRETATV